MNSRQRFLVLVAFSLAVPLTGALFHTLGPADSLGVAAVAAVLMSLYQLRRAARRKLVYGRRPAGHSAADPPASWSAPRVSSS
jgi:hypothetical protein